MYRPLAAVPCVVALAALATAACRHAPPPVRPPPAPPSPPAATLPAPSCRPDKAAPLPEDAGRTRHCVIDMGSRNVKLIVASVKGTDRLSLVDDRQCRARMQLGDKTLDPDTQTPKALGAADVDALIAVVKEYRALCARDGGTMAGAIATEWARRATNQDEVRRAVLERAGTELTIISSDEEARYGYQSATRGAAGKVVLDFGSRSFQISYLPRGAAAPEAVSVPLGIDEAGARFFDDRAHTSYRTARAAFIEAARPTLAPLLARIRGAINKKAVRAELFSLGENGDVPLALANRLRDPATGNSVDQAGYIAALKTFSATRTPEYGVVTAVLPARRFTTLARTLEKDAALFEELRSDKVRRVYGHKLLAFVALVTMVSAETGISKLVLVPHEMADGLIVERLKPEKRTQAARKAKTSR